MNYWAVKIERTVKILQAAIVLGWDVICSLFGLLAIASRRHQDNAEGDLVGVFNFRTRKFDNGTDPYGWYEEDV